MNRVRLPKKINVAVGATCTDAGYGIICLSEDGREKFERKEAFAARENHGPENENESEQKTEKKTQKQKIAQTSQSGGNGQTRCIVRRRHTVPNGQKNLR